jgi:hypothetical protein
MADTYPSESLYRSQEKSFEVAVERALRHLLPRKYSVQRIADQPSGEVDIIVSEKNNCILAIECYAPLQSTGASLEKMLSTTKGLCLRPRQLCFCSNVPWLPGQDSFDKTLGAGVAYLDVTGLAELVIAKKQERISGEELFSLLHNAREPITSAEVHYLLRTK